MLSAVRRERDGGPDFFISRESNPSQAGAFKSDSPKVTRSVVGQTCGTVHVDGRTDGRTVHADNLNKDRGSRGQLGKGGEKNAHIAESDEEAMDSQLI